MTINCHWSCLLNDACRRGLTCLFCVTVLLCRWVRHCGGCLPDNSSSFRKSSPTAWLTEEEKDKMKVSLAFSPKHLYHQRGSGCQTSVKFPVVISTATSLVMFPVTLFPSDVNTMIMVLKNSTSLFAVCWERK